MQDLIAQLTSSERTELYRRLGRAWDKTYKLWGYAQSRAAYALEDFDGMCSEVTDILNIINDVDAMTNRQREHVAAGSKHAEWCAGSSAHVGPAYVNDVDEPVFGIYANGAQIV